MIQATNDDKLRWAQQIISSNSAGALLEVINKIWEDGYRCAEAEVTYAVTPEEGRMR